MNVSHVLNACLRQSEAAKLFQICNMIYINGIHMLGYFQNGGYLSMQHAVLRLSRVWRCASLSRVRQLHVRHV